MATPYVKPAFTDKLLFINHDANNRKASPHRRAVFADVHGAYHKWRLRDDARRTSTQVPSTRQVSPAVVVSSAPREASRDSGYDFEAEVDDFTSQASPRPVSSKNLDPHFAGPSQSPGIATGRQDIRRAISPLTILQRGNSDPFSASSIEINPKVNDLIAFGRVYLHPALYASTAKTSTADIHSTRSWHDVTCSLDNKSLAYACISRSAFVLSFVSGDSDYLKQALVFRNRSSTVLRAQLAQVENDSSCLCAEQIYRPVFTLCLTDLFAKNFSEAAVHMKMLSSLLKTHGQSGQSGLDSKFLFRVVYNDVQRAAMSLTRPCFDVESGGWVCEQFASMWAEASTGFPDLPEVSLGLDTSVDNDNLRVILLGLRKIFGLAVIFITSPSLVKPSTSLFISSQAIVWMGRLTNHYVDFMTEPMGAIPGQLTQRAYDQAYMSLAALYWTRRVENIDSVPAGPGAKIYEAGPVILANLRVALEESKARAFPTELSQYSRARFWALYGAAQAEQSKDKNIPGADKGWFTRELTEQARSIGLISWQDARSVLQAFLYSDMVQPHGSQWFWKVVDLGSVDQGT